MGKKKKEAPKAEIPEWVLTFGDMMSLLLCFFILLAAFSEIKKPREYKELVESINSAMGANGGLGLAALLESVDNSMVSYRDERARRDDNKRNTDEDVNPSVPGREPQTSIVQEGARHAVGASIEFELGSWELSKRAQDLIRDQIAPKIRGLNYICTVVGHAWGTEEKRNGLVGAGAKAPARIAEFRYIRPVVRSSRHTPTRTSRARAVEPREYPAWPTKKPMLNQPKRVLPRRAADSRRCSSSRR